MPRDARVVLIGIDDYPATPHLALSGPVDDAIRFARFFRSEGVTPDRITLLLGTREPVGEALAGVTVRPADRRTIRDVLLTEIPAVGASDLYILWGGHGFVDVERNRRLRYPDARPTEPADLDVDSLLGTYASDLVPALDRQIWLIDACQIHDHSQATAGCHVRAVVPASVSSRIRPGTSSGYTPAPSSTACGRNVTAAPGTGPGPSS